MCKWVDLTFIVRHTHIDTHTVHKETFGDDGCVYYLDGGDGIGVDAYILTYPIVCSKPVQVFVY